MNKMFEEQYVEACVGQTEFVKGMMQAYYEIKEVMRERKILCIVSVSKELVDRLGGVDVMLKEGIDWRYRECSGARSNDDNTLLVMLMDVLKARENCRNDEMMFLISGGDEETEQYNVLFEFNMEDIYEEHGECEYTFAYGYYVLKKVVLEDIVMVTYHRLEDGDILEKKVVYERR